LLRKFSPVKDKYITARLTTKNHLDFTKPEASDLQCRMPLSAQVKIKNLQEPNYNSATEKSDVQQVSEIWSEETATHFSTRHADRPGVALAKYEF
jgi:hypothetical protein